MVKVKKCEFVKKELKFLEHIISREGIRTNPEKIEKMVNMEPPQKSKRVKVKIGPFLLLPTVYQRILRYN